MNLKEIIYNHQAELTALIALGTVIAVEETYIGIGKETIYSILEQAKEMFNQACNYFNPH